VKQKATKATKVRRDKNGLTRCRVCGCTETDACPGGCQWAPGEPDLCSVCDQAALALSDWELSARRPVLAALLREVKRRRLKL